MIGSLTVILMGNNLLIQKYKSWSIISIYFIIYYTQQSMKLAHVSVKSAGEQ